ncbi:AAA family ATPase [Chitinophaga filiformis]|uniref:AAA family ATPase n=1 Tax=Chitinophaga filiformis TaxID=104663 RepID=UPI001F265ED8|nr:AAA family ATPase [Chitinophaga filiformis]MCF6405302.1 AAA family ATPase [Chitinophaga filiformis]
MRILAIRFKNLASLEDTNEIDFTKEPLSQAGIFAITGPTGAGKSTLLDALCLALYAKTPRYQQAKETGIEIQDLAGNKLNQGDIRGILRDGTADGFAEVEFAGTDGNNYRATWSVKRARNKIDGNLQTDTMDLFNLSTNMAVPGKKTETLKEIERLVGLNFEQFTRSVLLAQGDFTAFLKADKDAKASLLEKLTGTDIYSEISRTVFDKYKQADQDLKNLKAQIAGIVSLTEEQQQELSAQREELLKKTEEQEKILAGLTDEINWHQSLAALTTSRDQAAQHYQQALTAMENAAERIRTFTLVENVQPARGLIAAKKASEAQLADKSAALQELSSRIQRTTESHQAALKQLDIASQELLSRQQDTARYQPDINRAKELDTLIAEKGRQVKTAETESGAAQQKHDAHLEALVKKEQEINTVSAGIARLEDWQKEHVSRQDIAENIIEITTQLGHASKWLPLQQRLTETKQATVAFLAETDKVITTLQEQVSQYQQQQTTLHSAYEQLNNTLAAIPLDEIKARESSLAGSIREADAAKAHWALLFTNLREKEHTTRQYDTCRQELTVKTTTLQEKQEQLKEAQAKKELADKLLHQARLQVAENVESLRAQLTPGDPCPVCGSRDHPFSEENPLAHTLLKGLEEESLATNRAYNTLAGEISSLTQLISRLEQETAAHEKALADRDQQINALEQQWQSFQLATVSATVAATERAAWLDTHIQQLLSKQRENTAQITSYEEKKRETDQLKLQLDTLNSALATANDQLKDKQRDKAGKQETLGQLQQQLDNITQDLDVMKEELAPFFNNPVWIENWKKDPQGFDDSIRSFAKRWKEHVQAITDNTQQLQVLRSALAEMRRQAPAIADDVTNKVNTLNGLKHQLQTLANERKALLSGDDVSTFETRLKQASDNAAAVQQTAHEAVTASKEELLTYTTGKVQTEKDIMLLSGNIEKQQHEIHIWITAYAAEHKMELSEDDLTQLLAYSTAWIDNERKEIRSIQQNVTTSRATLDERTLQVTNHTNKRIADRSLEEVMTLAADTRKLLRDLTNDRNNVEYQLRQDAENKSKIGGLQAAITAKTAVQENWSKLNELIGSADGKKFRQIAQEYTLDILLGYANMHLQMLTSRYKLLRIPGNLGLQVLDKDMGNELRTVFSLSGGESFLVSLALALGLASLSSSRMKVESLFIDEGFGALDPDTLNVAVDALERLHNQGRKVGVISHVQEMTERIPTQIKVIRLANGKSKVEVVGS